LHTRKQSLVSSIASKKKGETDYETLIEAVAADSESDEYSEQSDEDSETLQRQWLQLQQIEIRWRKRTRRR